MKRYLVLQPDPHAITAGHAAWKILGDPGGYLAGSPERAAARAVEFSIYAGPVRVVEVAKVTEVQVDRAVNS